jgi:hypothetical membrane protein
MSGDAATASRVGATAGLVGSGVIAVTSIVTALAYTGSAGESYSPFNHFVSELGEMANSELATLFNIGLIVAGLCLVAFMIGLRPYLDGGWGWAAMVLGVIAGVFGALVGVFPMDNRSIHAPVAGVFFLALMLTVLVFSIALLAGQAPRLPRWLLWPGGVAVVGSLLFLVLVATGGLDVPVPADRPGFLLVTSVEWVALLAIITWVACTSFVLLATEA